MIDAWIHDTADPVPADNIDYICPIGCSGASLQTYGQAGSKSYILSSPGLSRLSRKNDFVTTGGHSVSPLNQADLASHANSEISLCVCAKLIRRGAHQKIVAELAIISIDITKSMVEKYKPKRIGAPTPTWRTFLDQHVRDLVLIDFFIDPPARFRGGVRLHRAGPRLAANCSLQCDRTSYVAVD